MDFSDMFNKYDQNKEMQLKGIFVSLFIIENRISNANNKILKKITMKQWLMLALITETEGEKNLTRIGNIMGCSRQNVKKLALSLVDMGLLTLDTKGKKVLISLTNEAYTFFKEREASTSVAFQLLFKYFTETDIVNLYKILKKLYKGITDLEEFAEVE